MRVGSIPSYSTIPESRIAEAKAKHISSYKKWKAEDCL